MPTLLPETCLWAATGVALVATLLLARNRPPRWPVGVPRPKLQAPSDRTAADQWLAPEAASGERRRAARRVGNPTPVHLVVPSAAVPQPAAVIDRNSSGLQLVFDTALPPGLVIQLLPCHAPADTPWTDAVVRWCAPDAGRFLVGCKFTGDVPWGQLLLFG